MNYIVNKAISETLLFAIILFIIVYTTRSFDPCSTRSIISRNDRIEVINTRNLAMTEGLKTINDIVNVNDDDYMLYNHLKKIIALEEEEKNTLIIDQSKCM